MEREGRDPTPREDQGGDAACWAHLVCEGCGRVLEPGEVHDCEAAGDEPSRAR